MADRKEELSGGSPPKRPKLDHEESPSDPGSSNEGLIFTAHSDGVLSTSADAKCNLTGHDLASSTSDRDRVEGFVLGSKSGAVFENHDREIGESSHTAQVVDSVSHCETSGVDQNVTDSSFLILHDTLADISEIPSCSQTLSTSQISSASLIESRHDLSVYPGEDEPSSSQISVDSAKGVAMPGKAKSGSDSGSSSSSPNANAGGDDDSDLDLELGNWQPDPTPGPFGWLQRQMMTGVDPRSILQRMLPSSASLPDDMDDFEMWSLILDYFKMLQEPRRKKLDTINTFGDALRLLQTSNRILVLTGAGVSVSCGIPDFRSRDGVYARLAVDFPDLPDPQAMFDIHYFQRDPRPFYKFAKEIYPGQFRPSTSHKFISLLEHQNKLLRNYTQNIDTLEQVAGISKVVQCHGSFATAKCTNCGYKVDADAIREDIFNQVVPPCPKCPQDTDVQSVMKPEIVFFGEGLPNEFYNSLEEDKEHTDLLIVIGSSLKVRPVATIPNMIPAHIPQILINREPLRHMTFDIELLGDGDVIINELCRRLGDGWNHICHSDVELAETLEKPDSPGTVADRQAKIDFENAPTPPVINQDSNSNPPPADSGSHLGKQVQDADGVSSSSDTTCQERLPDKDTNEAEAAGLSTKDQNRLSESVISTAKIVDSVDNIPSESLRDQVSSKSDENNLHSNIKTSNGVGSSTEGEKESKKIEHNKNFASTSSNDATEQGIESDTKQSKVDNVVDSQPCPDAEAKRKSDNVSKQVSETNPDVPSHPDGSKQAGGNREAGKAESGKTDGTAGETSRKREMTGSSSKPCQSGNAEMESDHPVKKRRRSSIGTYLLPSTFLFVPPSRYIFHGAEVYPPSSPECSDDEDAEAYTQRLESAGDPLGLEHTHSANFDASGDLSDPFDPDQDNLIGNHQQPHPETVTRGEALPSSGEHTQGITDDSSLLPGNMHANLHGEEHIPLPPLVLSDVSESMLSSSDHPKMGQSSGVNINGNHSVHHEVGHSHNIDFHDFNGVRYKHERDMFGSSDMETHENHDHRHNMHVPSASGSNVSRTAEKEGGENVISAETLSSMQKTSNHPGTGSHDGSGGSSHDQFHHKPSTINASFIANGSTHQNVAPAGIHSAAGQMEKDNS